MSSLSCCFGNFTGDIRRKETRITWVALSALVVLAITDLALSKSIPAPVFLRWRVGSCVAVTVLSGAGARAELFTPDRYELHNT